MVKKRLFEIVDELKKNYSSVEIGKIFVGSVIELPHKCYLSKQYFSSGAERRKIKKSFIDNVKKNMYNERIQEKYIGMTSDNFNILFNSKGLREDPITIEGVLLKIINNSSNDKLLFKYISDSIYKGSKHYSNQEFIKRTGPRSFKEREYNKILEYLKDYQA